GGHQDHVLSALAPRDAHRQDHRHGQGRAPARDPGHADRAGDRGRQLAGLARDGRRRLSGRLFFGKARELRSLPVIFKENHMILDPGLNLTLRPMKYPVFFEMYKAAIKNTWTVEEVDFSHDLTDLR